MRRSAAVSFLCLAAPLAACHAESSSSGPTVTVERFLADAGCYAQCQQSAVPATELGLTECPKQAAPDPCAFSGGADQVRVTADYGEVQMDNSTTVPAPALALIADGVSLSSPSALVVGRGASNRFFASTSFTVPAIEAHALGFQVTASSSYQSELDGFTVTPAPATLTISGCPTSGACSMLAGVGQVAVTIIAPAITTPATATVIANLDGVPGAPATVNLVARDRFTAFGATVLNVPDDPNGTWSFAATVGGQLLTSSVQLTPTTLTVTVQNCAEDAGVCTISRSGPPASLVVSGPVLLLQTTGQITSTVDGINSVVNPVSLSETVGDIRRGKASFAVPATGTVWQFQAVVGRESGLSQAVQIVP